jgi:phosphatidylglycerophosphate synthase
MLDNWLSKSKLKNVFEKFVKKLFYNRISANNLTLIGLILGVISALLIFLSRKFYYEIEMIILTLIFLSLSFLFDAVDGSIARLEEPSIFGGILDLFCDRFVEVLIIIALISTDPQTLMWPGIFTLGAIILCITMFLVMGIVIEAENLEEKKKVIHYRIGLMERSETLIFLFLMVLLFFGPWRFILMWIFAILVFFTAILRLRDSYRIFKSDSDK